MTILYTIVPLHMVLEGHDTKPQWVEVQLGRRTLIIEPTTGTHGRVVRLISTDAMDYLRPEWQPGARFDYVRGLEDIN